MGARERKGMDHSITASYDTMKKLLWQKYLTREYSFLYISYAIDCYKIMKQTVGTTITYDISHGEGKLVSLYGIKDDILASYKMIEAIAKRDPQEIVRKMNTFDKLIAKNYSLFDQIKKTSDKTLLQALLIELDNVFLETLCYYLFFVFLGYAGDLPNIKKFLKTHGDRFHKIRLYSIDADMDTAFPKLFCKYDKKLLPLASFMSRTELLDYICGKPVDLHKIKNRKKNYLVVTKAGKTIEYPLSQIDTVIDKELSHLKISSDIKQLTGRIACKGKVTARAIIVFNTKDYKKIKEGDILVIPMTKPSIVPYLSGVTAIITDDGGALSHASIISREMKIPCIVGTEIATRVFKDGELLEVDADNGIVRKL
jgi:phosphoenolpyruvate synthase/pyruvate phosphate dikinase